MLVVNDSFYFTRRCSIEKCSVMTSGCASNFVGLRGKDNHRIDWWTVTTRTKKYLAKSLLAIVYRMKKHNINPLPRTQVLLSSLIPRLPPYNSMTRKSCYCCCKLWHPALLQLSQDWGRSFPGHARVHEPSRSMLFIPPNAAVDVFDIYCFCGECSVKQPRTYRSYIPPAGLILHLRTQCS